MPKRFGGNGSAMLRLSKLRVLCGAIIASMLYLSPSQAASPSDHAAVNAATANRSAAEEEERRELGPITTAEKQGYGCAIAGGAAMVLTALVGAGNSVLLFTGATTLPATTPTGVGLAVAGTVFASTCAIGALMAPAAIRLWRYYYDEEPISDVPRR